MIIQALNTFEDCYMHSAAAFLDEMGTDKRQLQVWEFWNTKMLVQIGPGNKMEASEVKRNQTKSQETK